MKMAVAHFQCAAWAFHTLPDVYPQVDTGLTTEDETSETTVQNL